MHRYGFSVYSDRNDLCHIGHGLHWYSRDLMHRHGLSVYRDWNDLRHIDHFYAGVLEILCIGMGFLFTGIGMTIATLAMVYTGVLEI